MIILNYKSKKELRENIGQSLNYTETSMFGPEYKSDGTVVGSNSLIQQIMKAENFLLK